MFRSINRSKILTTITRFLKIREIQTLTKPATPQTLEYKPLPCFGTFNVDHRKKNNRKVIEDGYKPDGTEDIQICFELLDENDIEFMTQYVVEHFTKHSNVCKHLGLKGEELIEIIHPQVVQWISSKNSIIVKHDEKIIGASFGSLHDRKEFDALYRGQLFHDNPKFVIKEDYGEDIKNGPYKNHNLNRIAVLLEELSWQTGKFLPKTAQKLGIHELVGVNKNYFNFGLATKSAAILQKLMIDQGCTHEAGYCVATGTWKMSKKFGHHTIYSLPYDRFLENGKPVFENLNDKAKAAYATYLDYEKDRYGCKCHI